jgi:TRAP-type C4-dicarboxylate transport system substrate-binding protein
MINQRKLDEIPVKMHWGLEVYQALNSGALDGIFVNIDSAYNLKLHQTAKYALVSKQLWLGHLYNKETFNHLSNEDKQAIQRAADYAYKQLGNVMDQSYDDMIDKLRQDGTQIQVLTNNDVSAWSTMTQFNDVQHEWSSTQASQGVTGSPKAIERVSILIENHLQK